MIILLALMIGNALVAWRLTHDGNAFIGNLNAFMAGFVAGELLLEIKKRIRR